MTLWLGLASGVALLALVAWRAHEPRFQGRTVHRWIYRLATCSDSQTCREAITVLEAVGPEAVPPLINLLKSPGSQILSWHVFVSSDFPFIKVQAIRTRDCLFFAQAALHPRSGTGKAAIPELQRSRGKSSWREGRGALIIRP